MERLLRKIIRRANQYLFKNFMDIEADSSRRVVLTYVFSMVGIIVFGIYFIYNAVEKTYSLMILNAVTVLCFSFIVIGLPKSNNYKMFSYLMLAFLFVYFILLFAFLETGAIASLLWYPIFPFVSILILGRRKGVNVSLALIGIILLTFIIQLLWDAIAVQFGVMLSLIASYFVVLFLVYYSDFLRHNITKRLIKSNLELKSVQNKLIKLNKLDQLSGVYNRNYLESFYSDTADQKKDKQKCLSMLMMDIDNFKPYNDTYGHINGDKVIASVANVIKDSWREDDIIVRYGGEEFLAILFDRDIKEAEYIANLIIEGVHNLEIKHKHSHTGFVTVSIGVTGCCSIGFIDKREMIKTADSALYEAKNKGKNCYVIKHFENCKE